MTVRVHVTRLLGSFIKKCTLNRRKRRVRPATLCDIRLLGLPDRLRLYFRIGLALIRVWRPAGQESGPAPTSSAISSLMISADIPSDGASCEIEILLGRGATILREDAPRRTTMTATPSALGAPKFFRKVSVSLANWRSNGSRRRCEGTTDRHHVAV
jgi:hypothetical protein